jgi:sulfotransferase
MSKIFFQSSLPRAGSTLLQNVMGQNPEQEMYKIYQYLELPQYKHDFNNVKQLTVENDSVYGIYGDHKIKKEIKPLIKDYKDVLGNNTCSFIRNKYDWFYQYFNY